MNEYYQGPAHPLTRSESHFHVDNRRPIIQRLIFASLVSLGGNQSPTLVGVSICVEGKRPATEINFILLLAGGLLLLGDHQESQLYEAPTGRIKYQKLCGSQLYRIFARGGGSGSPYTFPIHFPTFHI